MSFLDRLCERRALRQRIAASRDRLYRVALAWSGDALVVDEGTHHDSTAAGHIIQRLREAWIHIRV